MPGSGKKWPNLEAKLHEEWTGPVSVRRQGRKARAKRRERPRENEAEQERQEPGERSPRR